MLLGGMTKTDIVTAAQTKLRIAPVEEPPVDTDSVARGEIVQINPEETEKVGELAVTHVFEETPVEPEPKPVVSIQQ